MPLISTDQTRFIIVKVRTVKPNNNCVFKEHLEGTRMHCGLRWPASWCSVLWHTEETVSVSLVDGHYSVGGSHSFNFLSFSLAFPPVVIIPVGSPLVKATQCSAVTYSRKPSESIICSLPDFQILRCVPLTAIEPWSTEEYFFLSLGCKLLQGGFHMLPHL